MLPESPFYSGTGQVVGGIIFLGGLKIILISPFVAKKYLVS